MTSLVLSLSVAYAGIISEGRVIADDPALEERLPWACDAPLADAERVVLLLAQDAYGADAGLGGQPLRDALLIGRALEAEGFVVRACTDLGLDDLGAALSVFTADLAGHSSREVVGVYYAGQAFQIKGAAGQALDYLIPIGFSASDEASARAAAYPVDTLVRAVASPASATWQSFVILDACRREPWSSSWFRGPAGQSFGAINGAEVPFRAFVVYSTEPGSTATNDGAFARAFVEHIDDGQNLPVMLGEVKRSMERSGQVPTWVDRLESPLVLARAAQPALPSPDPAP